jgi:lipoprotein-anchoring transpeptidase ErfK/SrfK
VGGLKRRTGRLAVLGVVVVLLLSGTAGGAFAAYRSDLRSRAELPAHTAVAGVDVSRLTRADAIAVVRRTVQRHYDTKLTVTVGAQRYTTTRRALGAADNTEAAVDRAFAQAQGGTWYSRAWRQLLGGSTAPQIDVTVTEPDLGRLDKTIARMGRDAEIVPVDARAEVVGGEVRITPERAGQRLSRQAARGVWAKVLKDGRARTVQPTAVAPKVAASAYQTVLLVRRGANTLSLYRDGRLDRTYRVATGAPGFPTPLGRFTITLKRFRPTWVNPGSDWGKDLPASIPPGPGNPLGTRALNLDAPGIRIHGTEANSSIGTAASHGCIRMHMPDVEELYDLVEVGTTVFVTP